MAQGTKRGRPRRGFERIVATITKDGHGKVAADEAYFAGLGFTNPMQ